MKEIIMSYQAENKKISIVRHGAKPRDRRWSAGGRADYSVVIESADANLSKSFRGFGPALKFYRQFLT